MHYHVWKRYEALFAREPKPFNSRATANIGKRKRDMVLKCNGECLQGDSSIEAELQQHLEEAEL